MTNLPPKSYTTRMSLETFTKELEHLVAMFNNGQATYLSKEFKVMTQKTRDKDNREEAKARIFFESQGFTVKRIKGGRTKSPDFKIKDSDGSDYLLEVKHRIDNIEIKKDLYETGAVDRLRQVGPNKVIEQIIFTARKQFREWDRNHKYIWLIWLSACDELHPDLTFYQFIYTLYGIRHVICRKEDNIQGRRECFYARLGCFELWPELDGALVAKIDSAPRNISFCLNEFSRHFNFLRQTRLSKWFEADRMLINPQVIEALGLLTVDVASVDRQNEADLIKHLRNRYNDPNLIFCDFVSYRGMFVIPKTPFDNFRE